MAASNLSTGTRSTSVDRFRSPCRSWVLRSLSTIPPTLTSSPSIFARVASRSLAVSAISPVLMTERTCTTVRFTAGASFEPVSPSAASGAPTPTPSRATAPLSPPPAKSLVASSLIVPAPPLQAVVSARKATAAAAARERFRFLVMQV